MSKDSKPALPGFKVKIVLTNSLRNGGALPTHTAVAKIDRLGAWFDPDSANLKGRGRWDLKCHVVGQPLVNDRESGQVAAP